VEQTTEYTNKNLDDYHSYIHGWKKKAEKDGRNQSNTKSMICLQ
jgi:hypothetical protein